MKKRIMRAICAIAISLFCVPVITQANAAGATVPYTAPQTLTLSYTGSTQQIIVPGSSEHGVVKYWAYGHGADPAFMVDLFFSETIPAESAVDRYIIWYKVYADAGSGYSDTDFICLEYSWILPSVTTPPAANSGLAYNGSNQDLLASLGEAAGGEDCHMEFSVTAADASSPGGWSSSAPQAATAGDYKVWYRASAKTPTHPSYPNNVLWATSKPVSIPVTIQQKEITVTGIGVRDKIYDGSSEAQLDLSNVQLSGKVGVDDLSVTGVGTFSDANVGENKPVAISNLTLGGASAGNYVLAGSGQQTSATGTISPMPLADAAVELSGPFTYDGNLKTVDVTVKNNGSELAEGADYTVSGTTSATAPSTGEGYAVTVAAAGNGNYSGSKTVYWKINPAEISGISASGYTGTYDSQYHGIDVQVTAPANAAVTYREDQNTSYSAVCPQYRDAGTYTVYYKVAADNYETVEGSEQVVITAREVTVFGITARDKVYDGTTDAALDCTGASLSGNIGTDDLTVLSAEGEFADENAGANKTVQITSVTLGGADKGNYVIDAGGSQTTATASIAPRPISEVTLTLTPNTFVYDGSEKSPAVAATFGGETLALSTDYIVDSVASVTEATAVSTGNGYPITVIANEGGNYTGSQTAYWTITKGTLTGITADGVEETYDGTQYGIAVDNVPANAQVFYGESAGDCTLTESPKYADAGEYTVYYKVVKEGYYDFTGSAGVKINKAAQAAPPAPAVKADSITSSTIGLEPVTAPGQGAVQYACSTADTAPTDDGDWQSSPVFEGLSKNTRYYFFARYAGNRNYLTSPASAPAAQGETLDAYTVTYDLNTGSGTAPEEQTQDVGAAFTAAVQSGFQKAGYTFLGWATDAAATAVEYAAGALVSGIGEDDTLYAVWKINPYTITFVTNGGTALAPIEEDYGTPVAAQATTRTGYSFGGWYEDTALTVSFVFTEGTTMPAKNLTLYAKWNPLDGIVYTVNHHFEKLAGGYDTQTEQQSGVTGTDTNAQARAVTGFTARAFNQSEIAGDGTTAVDIYYVRNLHILTFKPENGEDAVISSVAYGAPVTAPADPVRPGYTFNGWGEVASVMPDGDLTYTAKWTANTYAVTLETNKGTVKAGNVTEYTCGEGAVLPTKVTRSGYEFDGWYDNKELKGEPISKITASEYGDKTFYAKWSRETVEVPAYPSEYDIGEGGGILVTDKTPVRGQIVTIKPDPDKGYEVDEVIVTDEDGDEIEVRENKDGTYSFRQPIGKVTISVAFAEAECDGGRRCPAHDYQDIDSTQWYHEAVDYVLKNGLMNGTSVTEKQFSPYGMTSRAMIVTILWRMEGEPVVNYLMQYEDVPQDTWYSEAVRWATSEGIVTGYDGRFNPTDTITREQFAAILYRYEQSVNKKLSGYEPSNVLALVFKDGFEISEYAKPAMQWAYHEGVVGGVGNGYLAPKSQMSRAEAAQMLMNYLER